MIGKGEIAPFRERLSMLLLFVVSIVLSLNVSHTKLRYKKNKHLLLQFYLHIKKFKNHCNFVYHMLIHCKDVASKTLQQL